MRTGMATTINTTAITNDDNDNRDKENKNNCWWKIIETIRIETDVWNEKKKKTNDPV